MDTYDVIENGRVVDRVARKYRPEANCPCDSCRDACDRLEREGDYVFTLYKRGKLAAVQAGCRTMSISDYRYHVEVEYPKTAKARATLAILARFEKALKPKRRKPVKTRGGLVKKPAKKAKGKK